MYYNDVLRPAFGGQTLNGFGYGVNQAPVFGHNHAPYAFNPVFSPGWNVPAYGYGVNASALPNTGYAFAAPSPFGWNATGVENSFIQHRMDALTGQIAQLTELVCRTTLSGQQIAPGVVGQPNAFAHAQAGLASGRVRESDSHLFWEVAFPGLSMGDLDIEVTGNRVICRTRIPLRTQLRAIGQLELPRGLEIFELPDGRVELNWLVPVSFIGKDVEACWKDGWIQICIPKAEVSHRQTVKITTDAAASNGVRKNGSRDMSA